MTLFTIHPDLSHWLILSTALFSIGLYGFLTRRNAIGILISIELMLNSAALNLIIFSKYIMPDDVAGQIFTMFIIAVAAAEAVVAMGIFVVLFGQRQTVDVTKIDSMHG